MDSKKIIEKLRGEADRERVSLYLSKALMDELKAVCAPISASRVIEELIKEFLTDHDQRRTTTRRIKKN